MKPEQVPIAMPQMPTLQYQGEGRSAGWKVIDRTTSGLPGHWAQHAYKEKCATREAWLSGIAPRTRQRWLDWESEGLIVCAEQRMNREGSSPSVARTRSGISKGEV